MDCKDNCKKEYSGRYDAYYCETCNRWLEDTCDEPECEFCAGRPLVPGKDE
jgi:hypothetical protein